MPPVVSGVRYGVFVRGILGSVTLWYNPSGFKSWIQRVCFKHVDIMFSAHMDM